MFTTEPGKPQRLLFDVKQQMNQAGRTRHLSRVLSSASIGLKRVDFDPSSAEHRLIFARFLTGGGWQNGTTFHVEAPHMTVPATVVNKLLTHHLDLELRAVITEVPVEEKVVEEEVTA